MRILRTALICCLASLLTPQAWPCEYLTVRDAAFQEPRDAHKLVLLTKESDHGIEEMESEIQGWFKGYEDSLNLEFVKVDVENEGIDWAEYGIPGPPPSTPATVLVGTNQRTRKNFFIRHWEPAPGLEELEEIISSPLRSSLTTPLLEQVGVMVHVPGTQEKREDVPEILQEMEKDWDKKEEAGISIVTLDRENPEEELLLSFLGVPKNGPDWVGILFGRGKAMDPWMGEDILEAELNGQLESLIGECSCLQTAGALGVDFPMVWTDEMDTRMVPLREPIEEEEPTALAGIRNSRMFGGPILMMACLFGAILVLGAGLFLVRSRRHSDPLVSSAGR